MRTLQHQLQNIADFCAGFELDPEPRAEDFAEGVLRKAWVTINDVQWCGDPASFQQLCFRALHNNLLGEAPTGPRLYDRIRRVIPGNCHPYRSLAQLAPDLRPIEWLWPGWLPDNALALIAARPGVGKSFICLDLAARVLTGAAWPDGAPNPRPPAAVIYVDGENIPQVHNERALAWGLPRDQLYLMLPEGDDVLVNLSAYRYQETLVQMVHRFKPKLVIVDALGAVLGKGENAVEDVRDVMAFLAGLAREYCVGVLIVHHLRKPLSGQPNVVEAIDPDQIRGSGHFTAMARVVMGLSPVQTGPRPEPDGPRRLQVIKSNLAKCPPPLGVRLAPIDAGEHVRVVYEPVAPEAFRQPVERTKAQEWLLSYLEEAGGTVAPAEAVLAGKAAGFCRSTIFHARQGLDGEIRNTNGQRTAGNLWQLALPESDVSDVSDVSKGCGGLGLRMDWPLDSQKCLDTSDTSDTSD